MPAMKYINKIRRINTLVKLRATGRPRELAGKLGISERRVYEYIHNMKELGAPITFSFYHNSYIYYQDGELVISFSSALIGHENARKIQGGCYLMTGKQPVIKIFVHSDRFNATAEIVHWQDIDLLPV